jgi:hypothetical protein|tara:strand:+ start:5980 stop:6303 length:324 start_codon:yes stop_codon:yes gene_type:complete
MEFITNKNGNLELKFSSPINVDNGTTNIPQGERESEMELFLDDDGVPSMIEWVVYDEEGDTEFVEGIGLWFEGKSLTDYDGVFELPMEAIKLIRKFGYSVPRYFEEN